MCPAILPPPHGSFFFLSSCAAGHGAPSYRAARNGSLARLRALARGPKRHARSTILFLRQAPPPPAGRELLCISSYRAARNGTPAARGPTQHARSASRSCVQPETARSLRAVLPAGLNLYPILSIDLPIYQSLYLPLYLLSIYLPLYLFISLSLYLSS